MTWCQTHDNHSVVNFKNYRSMVGIHLLANSMDMAQKGGLFCLQWPYLGGWKKGTSLRHIRGSFPESLLVILLAFLTDRKSSLPQGVTMSRDVDPRFTGTQELQTIARKHTSFSHCDVSTMWMQSLRPANVSVNRSIGEAQPYTYSTNKAV